MSAQTLADGDMSVQIYCSEALSLSRRPNGVPIFVYTSFNPVSSESLKNSVEDIKRDRNQTVTSTLACLSTV